MNMNKERLIIKTEGTGTPQTCDSSCLVVLLCAELEHIVEIQYVDNAVV